MCVCARVCARVCACVCACVCVQAGAAHASDLAGGDQGHGEADARAEIRKTGKYFHFFSQVCAVVVVVVVVCVWGGGVGGSGNAA